MKCRIGLLILAFFIASSSLIAKEFYLEVKNNSPISSDGKVILSNTRGKIEVKTWNKNEVSVEVLITVNARKQSDANDVFERIKISFDAKDNTVSALTQITEIPRWNWNYVRSVYTIDYIVYMPKTCDLNLYNKFGDALIEELAGTATLTVKHGNIRLKNIQNHLKLDLNYGNCTVMEAANSEIKMVHGNIRLKKVSNVNFFTSYSKVNVDLAGDIKSKSINDTYKIGIVNEFRNIGKYDKIDIQQVKKIVVVSEFSDFKIGLLEDSGDFDMLHGGVDIVEISQGFSDIFIVGEDTHFHFEVEEGSNYKMDATAQFASVKYPKVSNIVCQDKQGHERKVEFVVGKKSNPKSYIKAKVKYGNLKIK